MLSETQISTLERRRAQVLSEIASVGEMRAGSLTARFRRCGKAGCHCARPDDPGHGPVLLLTRHENGRTVTRIIRRTRKRTPGRGSRNIGASGGCRRSWRR